LNEFKAWIHPIIFRGWQGGEKMVLTWAVILMHEWSPNRTDGIHER
jgi:hypothetical protein